MHQPKICALQIKIAGWPTLLFFGVTLEDGSDNGIEYGKDYGK